MKLADCRAFASVGSSTLIRMAMIPMTTNSSTRVNALGNGRRMTELLAAGQALEKCNERGALPGGQSNVRSNSVYPAQSPSRRDRLGRTVAAVGALDVDDLRDRGEVTGF